MLKNCFSIWYKKQNMKDQENVEKFSKKWLLLFFVVFILWAGSAIVIRYVLPFVPEDSESIWSVRGTFGDMFGAVNALFSGLAFAGMIITLILQRKEFALQREELSNSIKALEGQKQELQQQKEVMKMQQKVANVQCFENGFFHLISQHYEIVKTIKFYKNDRIFVGEEAISSIVFQIYSKQNLKPDDKQFLENRGESNDPFSELKSSDLYVFFRHIYHILKFVDESKLIENEDRCKYADLLRSNLSDDDLQLIFLNELYPQYRKFKLLIEKYAFLQDIREDTRAKLYGMSENIDRYSDSAFKANQKNDGN